MSNLLKNLSAFYLLKMEGGQTFYMKIEIAHIVTLMLLEMKEGRKEMFYLTMHSTHFIYGYMASDIW